MLGKALQLAAAGNSSGDVVWPDISTASFVRFDTVVAGNDVRGVFFKPDGTKIYTCEFGDYIREATLSTCLLYTSPSPRDKRQSRMPSSA